MSTKFRLCDTVYNILGGYKRPGGNLKIPEVELLSIYGIDKGESFPILHEAKSYKKQYLYPFLWLI